MVSSPPGEIKVRHVGDTVTLNCSAGGSPLPKVMWFKGGRRINFRVMNDGINLISSEVVIHRFKPSDSGNYSCLFYNDKNVTTESNTTMSMSHFVHQQCLNSLLSGPHFSTALRGKLEIKHRTLLFMTA